MGAVVTLTLSALLLVSCEKSFVPTEESSEPDAFRILSTKLDEITFRGGAGVITLSDAPESVKSEADWVTATQADDKVNVTVAPNPLYESRTTRLRITKGDKELLVPITQLGVINVVGLKDVTFPAAGGTMVFPFAPGEEYSLTGFDDIPWLHFEIKDGSIILTADENGLYDPAREVVGHLTMGTMYDEDIRISQEEYQLAYDMLPGIYEMEYSTWLDADRLTTQVMILPLDKATNVLALATADYSFLVTFDPSKLTLNISGQELAWNRLNAPKVWLAPWESANGGSLWPRNEPTLVGEWNSDKQSPAFTFGPSDFRDDTWVSQDGNPVVVRGFILWDTSVNPSTEFLDVSPTRIVLPKLTRIGDLPPEIQD